MYERRTRLMGTSWRTILAGIPLLPLYSDSHQNVSVGAFVAAGLDADCDAHALPQPQCRHWSCGKEHRRVTSELLIEECDLRNL
jgi:hypothetical protein